MEGGAEQLAEGPGATIGVFVTGTGTGVGKTVVAAAIARTWAAAGARVAVFKPAVTGLDEPGETDHALLRRAAGSTQGDAEIAPYRYRPPVSPHLAAEQAGETIEPARLLAAARAAGGGAERLVCEGVGGLMVPLAWRVCCAEGNKLSTPYLIRDFAADLGLPLVVAAPPGLGAISDTLLTIEAARAAGLEVARVVLTPWPPEPSLVERSNRETIAELGAVEVDTLPRLDLAAPLSWPALDIAA